MRSLLAAALCAVTVFRPGVDTGGHPLCKPNLFVYVDDSTAQGKAWREAMEDRDFAGAIRERYSLHVLDYRTHKWNATLAGVRSLPAFFTPDMRWEGWEGKERTAQRLRLNWQPPATPSEVTSPAEPAAKPQPPANPVPPPPQPPDLRPELRKALDKLGTTDARVADVLERLDVLEMAHPAEVAKLRKDITDALAKVTANQNSLAAKLKAAAAAGAPAAAAAETGTDWWLAFLKPAAMALGVSSPIAAGLFFGLRVLAGGIRRRRAARAAAKQYADNSAKPALPAVAVVTTEAAPLPPRVIPETRFQTVEVDHWAEAFAYAKAEMGRKEPGAMGTLQAVDGLMRQFLASKGVATNAVRK